MHVDGTSLRVAATDLSRFLSCRHCTALDMAVARGKRERPYRHDPLLRILAGRGEKHERSYVETLRARGQVVVDLSDIEDFEQRMQSTLEAMRAGADAVVQGALRDGPWFGYPDVLQRVDRASSLGGWSYEVADTKLARETRAGTVSIHARTRARDAVLLSRYCTCYFHMLPADPIVPAHVRAISYKLHTANPLSNSSMPRAANLSANQLSLDVRAHAFYVISGPSRSMLGFAPWCSTRRSQFLPR